MSKQRSSVKEKSKSHRHAPLAKQIMDDGVIKKAQRTGKEKTFQEEQGHVQDKLSKKILQQAAMQQKEIETEAMAGYQEQQSGVNFQLDDDDDLKQQESSDEGEALEEDEEGDGESYFENLNIDRGDENALRAFMSQDAPKRVTLADLIMAKLQEKKTEAQTAASAAALDIPTIDPKVVEIYKKVGELLTRYRSGKLPRAFKIIPSLSNWEDILYLTNPEGWSAASVYQATRIFTSNLKANMAQRFFSLVLYPRIRDDIDEYKKLNAHLYNALKKALFKPDAFIKGILLPLAEAGDCTLREAVIIGSVLSKTSVPMLHSAAALLKMAEMEYTGSTSIFIRILVDKKYALPYRVIDALVFHFLRAEQDPRLYPVLWHQSLLAFVERYKCDISHEQKEHLLRVIKEKYHEGITPEIRREIINSTSREDAIMEKNQQQSQQQNQQLNSRLFNVY